MKKLRKVTAIAVTLLMLTGMTALFAIAEEPGTISVSLRIEGVEETLYYEKKIEITAGATVEDLMVQVNETDDTIGIVIEGSTVGDTYVPEIAGLAASAYGGYSGWSFRVNETAPTVGQSFVYLEDGDEVVYYYGDPWGEPGMQYPVVDLARLYTNDVIAFMSTDSTWDEEFNEVLTRNPVVGAKVTLNGNAWITDENGEIMITDKSGLAGMQSLQIERYDEEAGVPTVLRFAPDFEMYIPFADIPDGVWYDFPVEFCVRMGFFIGTSAAENLFSPGRYMRLAELVTVLGRIAGEDFSVPSDPWYASARDWAIDSGIVSEEEFVFDSSVTREEFIYLFYLTAGIVGTYDMAVRADITVASDYQQINEDYREAVSWAVASGIIHGTASDGLVIDPQGSMLRSYTCQMLFNYYTN